MQKTELAIEIYQDKIVENLNIPDKYNWKSKGSKISIGTQYVPYWKNGCKSKKQPSANDLNE